jgi:hypothetical protein
MRDAFQRGLNLQAVRSAFVSGRLRDHNLHPGAGVAIQHGSQWSREVRSVGSSARKLCRLANMSEGAPIRRAGSGRCIGTLRSLLCAVTDHENRCGDGEHQKCQRTELEQEMVQRLV